MSQAPTSRAGGGARTGLLAGAIAVGTVLLYVTLLLENQLLLVGMFALIAAASLVLARTGWGDRLGEAARAAPRQAGLLAAGAAVLLIAGFAADHFVLLMIATVLLLATAGLGINLQLGYAGIANFAGAAFFGIGAYGFALLSRLPLGDLPTVLLCGAVAALIGCVLILPVLRTRGHYAALVTIAFGVLAKSFLEVNDTLGGPQGIKMRALRLFGLSASDGFELFGLSVSSYVWYALIALAVFGFTAVLTRRVEHSWLGLNMDAVRSDELVSASFGLSIARWKVSAFLLGNFQIGLAGAVYGSMIGFINPNAVMFEQSLLLVAIVILGGVGSIPGTLLATSFVVLIPEKLQAVQEYRFMLFSALVVLVLLCRPQGLLPRRMRDFSLLGAGR